MIVSFVSRTAMEYIKVAALICLVGVAIAAEEKDPSDAKDTKKRDVGAILGGKLGKNGLDRGYLPPQKYYPGSQFGGQQVCDCRTGSPIGGGYPGSYPGSSYPGGYPGSAGGYPGSVGGYPGSTGGYPGSVGGYPGSTGGYPGSAGGYPGGIGGGISGGSFGGGFVDDTVQVYPKGQVSGVGPSGFGPSGISSNSAFGVSSSYGVPSGPSGFIGAKGIGGGPTGSGFIGGSSGSSGFVGGSSGFLGGGPSGSGFIGGSRPGLEGPLPAGRPGSSIGIASSSYTSSGSVGLIGGADGYNYDRPSVPFP